MIGQIGIVHADEHVEHIFGEHRHRQPHELAEELAIGFGRVGRGGRRKGSCG
jgi:hypothetical protein